MALTRANVARLQVQLNDGAIVDGHDPNHDVYRTAVGRGSSFSDSDFFSSEAILDSDGSVQELIAAGGAALENAIAAFFDGDVELHGESIHIHIVPVN